ncbi:hypothetical protein BGZ49_010016 [Haplosporangium sp. Z 27]|nr:hypothetical protein BGZ49_010016 [Haplosporangium sp. Z 27]
MAHQENPKRRQLPGGLKPDITIIDEAHPLSVVDPALEELLKVLAPAIQENYLEVKHLDQDKKSHEFEFQPVAFTTQVVAGTNYYVKLLVHDKCHDAHSNEKEYIHIRIFSQVWTKTFQLSGIAVNKHKEDSLKDPLTPISNEEEPEKEA